jgi:chromosome partitioning protein
LHRIVALANQKGGVGKTTTAVSLGVFLASSGYRTLLVDLDPQANATSSLGIDTRRLEPSVYDVLTGDRAVADCVLRDVRGGLDLVPSTGSLAGAEVELASTPRREFRLQRALHPIARDYALILIDCPPSLGLLTVNALTAAREVIIPIQCEYLALEGLVQLVNTIDLIKRRLNPPLDVIGVLMTMFDARTRLAVQVVEEVRRFFPRRMFRTIVPRTVRLAEAPSFGKAIFEYDPSSRGAQAYAALGMEVIERLQLPTPIGSHATSRA